MDKILGTYTTKRRTKRWPLALFYNILDVAALAAYIIYCDSNNTPCCTAKMSCRRILLTEMGQTLSYPLIQQRAANPLSVRHCSIRNAIECIMGMSIDKIRTSNQSNDFVANEDKDKDKTGRQKVKGDCYICKETVQHRRSTRKACGK